MASSISGQNNPLLSFLSLPKEMQASLFFDFLGEKEQQAMLKTSRMGYTIIKEISAEEIEMASSSLSWRLLAYYPTVARGDASASSSTFIPEWITALLRRTEPCRVDLGGIKETIAQGAFERRVLGNLAEHKWKEMNRQLVAFLKSPEGARACFHAVHSLSLFADNPFTVTLLTPFSQLREITILGWRSNQELLSEWTSKLQNFFPFLERATYQHPHAEEVYSTIIEFYPRISHRSDEEEGDVSKERCQGEVRGGVRRLIFNCLASNREASIRAQEEGTDLVKVLTLSPDLEEFSSVKTLSYADQFAQVFEPSAVTFPRLQTLNLSGNNISAPAVLQFLARGSLSLKTLILRDALNMRWRELREGIVSRNLTFPQLTELSFGQFVDTKTFFQFIKRSPMLEKLSIEGCCWSWFENHYRLNLERLLEQNFSLPKKLKELDLRRAHSSVHMLAEILKRTPVLEKLWLSLFKVKEEGEFRNILEQQNALPANLKTVYLQNFPEALETVNCALRELYHAFPEAEVRDAETLEPMPCPPSSRGGGSARRGRSVVSDRSP